MKVSPPRKGEIDSWWLLWSEVLERGSRPRPRDGRRIRSLAELLLQARILRNPT